MRITESQLRKVIRQIIVESIHISEDLSVGDRVMILDLHPGQIGTYANPGYVEEIQGNTVRVKLQSPGGFTSKIIPASNLIKATGYRSQDIQIWKSSKKS